MRTIHRNSAHAKRTPLPLVDPIQHAMSGAACLTKGQLETLMAPNRAAVAALQYGQFNEHHWRVLVDAFNIAEVLAKPPVNLANDHADKFNDAHCVLLALSEQYRDRRSWTARGHQLQTIKDAMFIFQIQLENVAQGEFERTVEKLKRRMIEALRGNGGNVRLVKALS